jgi:hypothetical protein
LADVQNFSAPIHNFDAATAIGAVASALWRVRGIFRCSTLPAAAARLAIQAVFFFSTRSCFGCHPDDGDKIRQAQVWKPAA